MDEDVGLKIPIDADVNPLQNAMQGVKDKVSGAMGGVKNTLSNIKDALGAVGIAAAGYLKGAIDSAANAEQANTRLKTLITNQGLSWSSTSKQVSNFKNSIMDMSTYSAGEASSALTNMISKHMKMADAMKSESALTNLAAARNISLTAASNILSSAYNGKYGQLVKLGLATKDEIKNGLSYDEVLQRISKTMGGSASAQLNTYKGQMQQFNNEMGSLKTSIGTFLLPYLTQFAKFLDNIAKSLNNLDPSVKQAIAVALSATAVIGTLVGGAGVLQKVLTILGPVATGLGTTIGGMVLPITAVVAAIALLVVAWTKDWGGIREKTQKVIDFIKPYIINGFNAMKEWFNTNLPLVKELIHKVLGDIEAFWKAHGQTIITVLKNTFDIIKTVVTTVMRVIGDIITFALNLLNGNWGKAWKALVDAVKTIFGGVGRIIKDIFNSVWVIFKDAVNTTYNWGKNLINGFINGIKSMFGAIGKVANSVMATVKKFLGFHSPSEKGEGQHIVEWGQGLVNGFMSGVKSKLPDLSSLLNDAIPNLNLNANINSSAFSTATAATGYNTANITLQLDGKTIASVVGQPLVQNIRIKNGLKF